MATEKSATTPPYRGSLKHKLWRPGGGYGTLCPKWTHETDSCGFAGDVYRHPWSKTWAHTLFERSEEYGGHRWATERGIAFTAMPSGDGTWHGYPVTWHDVPATVQNRLIDRGDVSSRQIRKQKSIDPDDLVWALKSDDEQLG